MDSWDYYYHDVHRFPKRGDLSYIPARIYVIVELDEETGKFKMRDSVYCTGWDSVSEILRYIDAPYGRYVTVWKRECGDMSYKYVATPLMIDGKPSGEYMFESDVKDAHDIDAFLIYRGDKIYIQSNENDGVEVLNETDFEHSYADY